MLAGRAAQKLDDMTEMKGFANDEIFTGRLETLQAEAKAADGWTEMINEEKFKMVTKKVRPDETLLRGALELDLPASQTLLMFTYVGAERKEWDDQCKSSEVVKELAAGDKVCKWELKLNRAIKAVMKMPDKICMRMIVRENWPEQGSFGYALLPYDLEKNLTLEEFGPMKIKCGVIKPHPTDPNKSNIETLESGNLKFVPNFVLKGLMKKMGLKKIQDMVEKYKKSSIYKQNL